MHVIKVNLKKRSYNIIIGFNIIKQLGRILSSLDIGQAAYIITNNTIKKTYGKLLAKTLKNSGFDIRFKAVPDSEKSKSIETASRVIKDIVGFDKKRKIFIIAFGGGVIGDLSGFLASIYKRGIPYIQIPTTLLAQVDSSIGGKTAVDLLEGKNLLGAFYQPRLVFSDIKFLNSLSLRQIRNGLSEIIKYAVISDPLLFKYLEKRRLNILKLNYKDLEYIIKRCSFIKAKVVSSDEREEKGRRTILNFGHTIGHAIEAASGFSSYNHGEAVALGMLVASDLSKKINLIDDSVAKRIEGLIKIVGLPTKIRGVSLQKIISAHYRDKKFIGAKNKFVLIKGIGKTKIIEDIPLAKIRESIKERI